MQDYTYTSSPMVGACDGKLRAVVSLKPFRHVFKLINAASIIEGNGILILLSSSLLFPWSLTI